MFMRAHSEQTYAIMRIAFGFVFLCHGSQKLLGIPAGGPEQLNAMLGVAGAIELVGGLCIMIGLLTSWMAFLSSGLMAAAYWMAHGTNALLPIQNHGELAFMYCFGFLYMAARGSGIWSVDAARGA